MKENPLSSCIRCGKPVTKVISAPAIMFKGSGWYVTDYSDKMKPPTPSEATEKPANSQPEKKSEAGTTAPPPASTPPPPAGTSSPASSTTSAPTTSGTASSGSSTPPSTGSSSSS